MGGLSSILDYVLLICNRYVWLRAIHGELSIVDVVGAFSLLLSLQPVW